MGAHHDDIGGSSSSSSSNLGVSHMVGNVADHEPIRWHARPSHVACVEETKDQPTCVLWCGEAPEKRLGAYENSCHGPGPDCDCDSCLHHCQPGVGPYHVHATCQDCDSCYDANAQCFDCERGCDYGYGYGYGCGCDYDFGCGDELGQHTLRLCCCFRCRHQHQRQRQQRYDVRDCGYDFDYVLDVLVDCDLVHDCVDALRGTRFAGAVVVAAAGMLWAERGVVVVGGAASQFLAAVGRQETWHGCHLGDIDLHDLLLLVAQTLEAVAVVVEVANPEGLLHCSRQPFQALSNHRLAYPSLDRHVVVGAAAADTAAADTAAVDDIVVVVDDAAW